jgi:hypothetical protein
MAPALIQPAPPTPVPFRHPMAAALFAGLARRPRRASYWLHALGSDLDNGDKTRALLNAPKPIRAERINVTTNVPEPLITEGEAADILRVSLTSLRRWRRQGCGPVFRKLGRTVRYRPNDLSDFVASAGRISTSNTGTTSSQRRAA